MQRYDLKKTGIAIPILLRSVNKVVNLEAKLDTGATYCVFRRAIGELLGLDIEAGSRQEINTPMGVFEAYGHEVELETLGVQMRASVYFAADERFDRDVLGRFGWLNRLRVAIVDHDGLLYLSHYDEGA